MSARNQDGIDLFFVTDLAEIVRVDDLWFLFSGFFRLHIVFGCILLLVREVILDIRFIDQGHSFGDLFVMSNPISKHLFLGFGGNEIYGFGKRLWMLRPWVYLMDVGIFHDSKLEKRFLARQRLSGVDVAPTALANIVLFIQLTLQGVYGIAGFYIHLELLSDYVFHEHSHADLVLVPFPLGNVCPRKAVLDFLFRATIVSNQKSSPRESDKVRRMEPLIDDCIFHIATMMHPLDYLAWRLAWKRISKILEITKLPEIYRNLLSKMTWYRRHGTFGLATPADKMKLYLDVMRGKMSARAFRQAIAMKEDPKTNPVGSMWNGYHWDVSLIKTGKEGDGFPFDLKVYVTCFEFDQELELRISTSRQNRILDLEISKPKRNLNFIQDDPWRWIGDNEFTIPNLFSPMTLEVNFRENFVFIKAMIEYRASKTKKRGGGWRHRFAVFPIDLATMRMGIPRQSKL